MITSNPCGLLCFALFPLLVALFAWRRKSYGVAAFCVISIPFGVGPLVALLALFKLRKWERLLDVWLLLVSVTILLMMAYVINHYFLFAGR